MNTPVERLKRRKEFLDVATSKINIVKPGLILQVRKLPSEIDKIRVGFTASRKVVCGLQLPKGRLKLLCDVNSNLLQCLAMLCHYCPSRYLKPSFWQTFEDMSAALIGLKLNGAIMIQGRNYRTTKSTVAKIYQVKVAIGQVKWNKKSNFGRVTLHRNFNWMSYFLRPLPAYTSGNTR